MKTRLRSVLPLILLTMVVVAPRGVEAKPLTQDKVRALLASLPELEALGQKYDETDPLPRIGGDPEDGADAAARMRKGMLTGALTELRAHQAWQEFGALAKSHGFASVEEWANVGDRVMAGFIQLQIATEAPEAAQQMRAARESIEGNADIPEAQKQMLLAQLDEQLKMFDALQHSEILEDGDIAVLEPMIDEIRAAMGGDEDE